MRVFNFYTRRWWMPSATSIATLLFCLLFMHVTNAYTDAAFVGYITAMSIAILGMLASAIIMHKKSRNGAALFNLIMIHIMMIASYFGIHILLFASLFLNPGEDGLTSDWKVTSITWGPSEGGFADNLKVPDDVQVADALEALPNCPLPQIRDKFQIALLGSLSMTSGDPSVSCDISSLCAIHKCNRDLLERHLRTSPCWRVFTERGSRYATRRWARSGHWQYSMHGWYSSFFSGDGLPYQSRTTIGLSGLPWWRGDEHTNWVENGKVGPLVLGDSNQMKSSHLVIENEDIVLELCEESHGENRPMTKASLRFLDDEFKALAQAGTWDMAAKRLPDSAVKTGEPSLTLVNSMQGGIYDCYLWINPGESGMVYLKAFEVTKGTQLSADRLKERSNEWVGWSENPKELFFSNTHFTIYEGDWDQMYAARFEVWFVPDSGAPEKKLLERVFKICGWMR